MFKKIGRSILRKTGILPTSAPVDDLRKRAEAGGPDFECAAVKASRRSTGRRSLQQHREHAECCRCSRELGP